MDLLFHRTNMMATIRIMVVTETTAAIMAIFFLKWKKNTTSIAELKKQIIKVYQSTSESLKIVLQIKRYILTCKLLEKKKCTETPLYKMS